MRGKVVNHRELMVLLNEMFINGEELIKVSYPFTELELMELDMNRFSIRNVVRYRDFNDHRNEILEGITENFVMHDLPVYSDIMNSFVSSKIVPFVNIDEVYAQLLRLREDIRNPHRRPKPMYIALDTNIAYLRFFSRYLGETVSGASPVMAPDFRYVVSSIVQQEVDARIQDKYRPSTIEAMRRSFKHDWLLSEFHNASARSTRKAKEAQNELTYLMQDLKALRVVGEQFSEDKEKRDIMIARSYQDFSRGKDYDVTLLTADQDMAYHARNAEIPCEILVLPHEVPGRIDELTQWHMADLLYDLAVTFGAIMLGTSVIILGEWKGKVESDWNAENLKLLVDKRSGIYEEMERDMNIIRGIERIESR